MSLQKTIAKPIEYIGVEPYGGCEVNVLIMPADEGTGILFHTPTGTVSAELENACAPRASIMVKNKTAAVEHIEHFLATLYAYEIDNAHVTLNRNHSVSFSLLSTFSSSKSTQVIPNLPRRETTLCEKIEKAGIKTLGKERKKWSLRETTKLEYPGLSFEREQEGLSIQAATKYPGIGLQEIKFQINPDLYKKELAPARTYSKYFPADAPRPFLKFLGYAIAPLVYPSFGIGNGLTESDIFVPTRKPEKWKTHELLPCEVARHKIVDLLGALALIGGRLEGMEINTYLSGHRNDLQVLKQLRKHLVSS